MYFNDKTVFSELKNRDVFKLNTPSSNYYIKITEFETCSGDVYNSTIIPINPRDYDSYSYFYDDEEVIFIDNLDSCILERLKEEMKIKKSLED